MKDPNGPKFPPVIELLALEEGPELCGPKDHNGPKLPPVTKLLLILVPRFVLPQTLANLPPLKKLFLLPQTAVWLLHMLARVCRQILSYFFYIEEIATELD